MAQVPKGEPRTVPDPAGEKVDEMLRQERLRRQREDAAAAKRSGLSNVPRLSPFEFRVEDLDLPRGPALIVTVGGKTYREVDNGRANVLVPVDNSPLTPAEQAARRDGVVRALFMAEHPFGTLAYGAATMAGASPKARDGALAAGGWLDEAAPGGVSRTRVVRPQPNSPQQPLNLTRPRIMSRAPNPDGQATGGAATVISSVLGTGTKASGRIKPVGYVSNDPPWKHERGHVIAGWFGGSGRDRANLMTLERRANQEHMKGFESDVARRARGGETVEYSVTPFYDNGSSPPSMVLMTAFGHREGPKARLVRNLAGPPR